MSLIENEEKILRHTSVQNNDRHREGLRIFTKLHLIPVRFYLNDYIHLKSSLAVELSFPKVKPSPIVVNI